MTEGNFSLVEKDHAKKRRMSSDIVAMDMAQPENSAFEKKNGFFVTRGTAWLLLLLFICGLLATGLLVYYYAPDPYPSTVAELHQHETVHINEVKAESKFPMAQRPSTTTTTSPTTSPTSASPTSTSSEAPNMKEMKEMHEDQIEEKEEEIEQEVKSTMHSPEMQEEEEQPAEKPDVRLPRSLKPVHYQVKLQPFVNGNFSIFGYVEIEMEVLEPTAEIVLHIYDIVTHNQTVKLVPADTPDHLGLEIVKHEYDHGRHFYIAHLEEPLEAGQNYILSMNFLGYLNDELKGFYRSSYKDEEGNERWLATTQFQPTHARKAFPCFDEPGMKATFEVYLAREENMTSISNMPLAETLPFEDQEGWYWDRFNTSVPMSTYLVAFVVSDFVYLNSTSDNGTLFRVWARESVINQAEYSNDIGPKILTHFEDYFQVPYPLPKQDMIALPDFSAGAMENWGLITYRETAMLFDPESSAPENQRWVSLVVAHELAHQWFGNIVTPKWWDDLWLNEGFASYVQYIGMDHVKPTWRVMEQFIVDTLQSVFALDCLESSHPISIKVGHPDEISQIFDGISYNKGSSIIRMMSHFLTEASLRKGLSNYLEAFQYDNAEQDDLWEYLTTAAHEDGTLPSDLTVKTIMDTWTLQMGYPVINVTRSLDGTTATVTQERYLLNKKNSMDDRHYSWWVPLNYASQSNPNFTVTSPSVWMKASESEVTVSSLPSSEEWVIFNVQETGFYRVNYDDDNWNLIIQQLKTDHEVIHTINRAQIIDDAMDLARAGHLSYDIALDIYTYLGNETEYVPWKSAVNKLDYLVNLFQRTGAYGALQNYIKDMIVPLYESVGFADNASDHLLTQFKRKTALTWACKLGHQECLDSASAFFQQWMEDPQNNNIISPNIKDTVYCTAIEAGGENEWEFAWNMYLETNVASEKSKLLKAMGCTKKIWLLSRYLEMAFMKDSGIRLQDSDTVFSAVAKNPVGRPLAWTYLRDNWQKIHKYFGKANKRVLKSVTAGFNTKQQLREVKLFQEEHEDDLGAASRAVENAIERITNDIAWMDNNYQNIVDWLESQGYNSKVSNV
ncbi:LOW QUALITY PROTEIN: aminopeptidase N-like [Palaemon carinicauda]|uniref:LOW QUALITY PROTEIN: aminopeptidase N-like n=1 Tax=Palaemon carinicauda TaxID=392227 RepID=UPI0035B62500